MGLPRSTGAYADIRPILDAALRSKGGRYELATKNQAIRWRQRAYQYRKLLRELEEQRSLPGIEPTTPYDTIRITVEDNVCVIGFFEPKGTWVPNEGPAEDPIAEDAARRKDELEESAHAFAKQLMGKD